MKSEFFRTLCNNRSLPLVVWVNRMIREMKFKLLTQRHSDDIYRFARSILGNDADAEDATQEILLKLWDHIGGIPVMKAKAWIMKTTRNHCLNMLRTRKRSAHVISGDDGLLESLPDESSREPGHDAHVQTLRAQIDQALNQLPENLRSVFVLHEVNGLKYREIAETMDLPINSVKVYISRSRLKLKELLSKEAHI